MDHLLCLFEAKEGTDEWKRLDCDKWKEAKIDPQSIAKAKAKADALAKEIEKKKLR